MARTGRHRATPGPRPPLREIYRAAAAAGGGPGHPPLRGQRRLWRTPSGCCPPPPPLDAVRSPEVGHEDGHPHALVDHRAVVAASSSPSPDGKHAATGGVVDVHHLRRPLLL